MRNTDYACMFTVSFAMGLSHGLVPSAVRSLTSSAEGDMEGLECDEATACEHVKKNALTQRSGS